MITGDHAVTARAIAEDLGHRGTPTTRCSPAPTSAMTTTSSNEAVATCRSTPGSRPRTSCASSGPAGARRGGGRHRRRRQRRAGAEGGRHRGRHGRSGTDVAREASDMVLADDNFVSIAAAVEEGRVTFDNVRKVTFFLVSTGAATIIAITVGVWLQWPLLMLPAQLLWLNLVTNGLQDVALAFEPGEDGLAVEVAADDEGVTVDRRGVVEHRGADLLVGGADDLHDLVGVTRGRLVGRERGLRATDVVDDHVELTGLDALDRLVPEAGRGEDVDVVAEALEVLAVDLGQGDGLGEVLAADHDLRTVAGSRSPGPRRHRRSHRTRRTGQRRRSRRSRPG
jgi:hypothetical protein